MQWEGYFPVNSVPEVSQLHLLSHRLRQPKPSDEPSSTTSSILPREDKDPANNESQPIFAINTREAHQGTVHFKLLLYFYDAGATGSILNYFNIVACRSQTKFLIRVKNNSILKMLKSHFNRWHQVTVPALLKIPKLSRNIRTRRVSTRISTHCPPCKEPGKFWLLSFIPEQIQLLRKDSGNSRSRSFKNSF